MSIRAYKIKKIELKKDFTFNVGDNFNWLESISSCTFNNNGECREMEFSKDDVNNSLKDWEGDKERTAILKNILKDFNDDDDEYIAYQCY